jgi:hypothetical protein
LREYCGLTTIFPILEFKMELTKQAIDQLQLEVSQAIDVQSEALTPAGIPIATICANKDLIMGFLQALVALLPGVLGKIAGQAVVAAAETWFAKKCQG